MTCEYDLTCTVKSQARCKYWDICELRTVQLLEEEWKRQDAEMLARHKLFPFHDYAQTARFGDRVHDFGGFDGVNRRDDKNAQV